MQKFEAPPLVIVVGDKGGVGKSIGALTLITMKPSAVGRGSIPTTSVQKRKRAPSAPRRRVARKRRN